MQIEYRDGLLFTSIEIVYQGRSKLIDNMVIDTGTVKTLISQNAVKDIDLRVEMGRSNCYLLWNRWKRARIYEEIGLY
ncbi:hypothetical protein J2S06_002789 [Bacillus alveayuensis]|uniref:Aspartyl protease n=1 Tax=Aeribacillus alveayuensis TaxID=279215 RepID=A0ABT9VRT2_9BACI|nr:hypothetical protein [Bacillus alveayuensis]